MRHNGGRNGGELSEEQVLREIADRVTSLGGIRAAARAWRCSPSYLCAVLNGSRRPGPLVLRPNRIRLERRFVRER